MPKEGCGIIFYELEDMEQVLIFHNPGAGATDHSKEALIESVCREGYKYKYQSVKDDQWASYTVNDADLLVVAGGDGTVRRVLQYLDGHKSLLALPVALIPLGTANNVATSLNIHDDGNLPSGWDTAPCVGFDINRIITGGEDIMMESFGAGLFANHIRKMTEIPNGEDSTDKRIMEDLRRLLENLKDEKPCYYDVELDGKDHSGEYFMVEVMNTPMLGPNLRLANEADPGDGLLDVVLLSEYDRDFLSAYLSERIEKRQPQFHFDFYRASHILISTEKGVYHLDDRLTDVKKGGRAEIMSCKHKIRVLV